MAVFRNTTSDAYFRTSRLAYQELQSPNWETTSPGMADDLLGMALSPWSLPTQACEPVSTLIGRKYAGEEAKRFRETDEIFQNHTCYSPLPSL
ncbi:hypothetical protein F4776DRAFT_663800 [Hypoxylon sp. NC0597]|nr:hypothetical protein F4776DRAFT_663800 [Hypoxylon sp. NC0597]